MWSIRGVALSMDKKIGEFDEDEVAGGYAVSRAGGVD